MNNRMKEVRRALELTQSEFGKKIDAKQNHVASMESGRRDITEKTKKLICLEFGVSQKWLETGEGKMFESNPESDDIIELYDRIKDKIPRRMIKQAKQFLEKANTFTEEDWEALSRLADKILGSVK